MNYMNPEYIRLASREIQWGRRIYVLHYDLIIDKLRYYNSIIEEYGVSVSSVCAGETNKHEVRRITCNEDWIMYAISLVICGAIFPDELDETLENILN